MTDEDLMAAVRDGSREAFATLFDRYRQAIWGFFRRRVADRGRAEELTQDAFVAVLEGAGRYEARGPFRSYLFGIAYNILLAERRRAAAPPVPLRQEIAAAPADRDATLWIQSALAQLDDGEYEELSYLEIAHLQAIPLNTVRSRLFRARMALKQVLELEGTRASVGAGHAAR
jgi:RNA polymerase sigma-70 factor (ECF subfamily)